VGTVYRCAVCRLELIVDEETMRMKVVPLAQADEASQDKKPRKR